jgi:GntR family transcriptional regulator/MocR family aminotransferase
VVIEAYQRLAADGIVLGRGRAGTVVVARPPAASPALVSTAPLPRGREFPDPRQPDVFEALRAVPARIDLSPGVPDLAAFPRAAWLRAERATLSSLGPSTLGYGDAQGEPALRAAVSGWLRRNRGIMAAPGEVIVVSGVAQALGLVARVLLEIGITEVAVEDPGSLGARQHLQHWGLATPPVPVDGHGIRTDQLRKLGASAVLLTPAHQFPTGVVLDGERRRDLLGWAEAGGFILEDDYDAEHRYDRPPTPALRSLLVDHLFYMGSVSKILAPALRTAWVVAPERLREAVISAKRFADLGNPVLPQLALARLIESGELDRHIRLMRRHHRRRRDAMIEAIEQHLPGARIHGAAAGLHLTVSLGSPVDDTELAARCLAHGVRVHPLSWYAQRRGTPGLVLGYAMSRSSEIAEGVATVGRVYGAMAPDGSLTTGNGSAGGRPPHRGQLQRCPDDPRIAGHRGLSGRPQQGPIGRSGRPSHRWLPGGQLRLSSGPRPGGGSR